MPKLLESRSGVGGSTTRVERDAAGGIDRHWNEVRALADLPPHSALLQGDGDPAPRFANTCRETFILDARRTRTELRLPDGTLSVSRSQGEDALVVVWSTGRRVEIKPCGDILADAALNIGDLLVLALDNGIRRFSFDLARMSAMGEEMLGVLESLGRHLAREGDGCELVFLNIPGDIRPRLDGLELPRATPPGGEPRPCLCSET